MEDSESGDWKSRQKAYEGILQYMANPTQQLLNQLHRVLPSYIADSNPNCQRIALSICEMFFKAANNINYPQFSQVLIDKCLESKQQITDTANGLILQCLKADTEKVTDQLFNNIQNRSTAYIQSVLSIIVAHLAALTTKDAKEALMLNDRLEPLLEYKDSSIRKDVAAAIASCRFVAGTDADTLGASMTDPYVPNSDYSPKEKKSQIKVDDKHWATLISNDNWKDRKMGYEELLCSLDEDSNLQTIEHYFLVQAGAEKHIICEGIVVQIIEKMANIFKTQLARKLTNYINPIINMMTAKRQSRITSLQKAFDAVATNAVSSPYETPFVEHLLKMMNSSSTRLKEEAIAFIQRCPVYPISSPVMDSLKSLTSDPAVSVREAATSAIGTQKPEKVEVSFQAPNRSKSSRRENANDQVRASSRRRVSIQNAQATWQAWVDPETLKLLQSTGQWTSIQKGLELLRQQFDEDPSQPSAVVHGLCSLFLGKTFTPKVMANLLSSIEYYLRSEPEKISDEAYVSAVNFSLDKIQEKRFEQSVFEILDIAAENNSAQFVFSILYPHLSAKNPIIPQRIATYFAHHLNLYKRDAGINIEDFANQIKPLFTHNDPGVRKAAQDCSNEISEFDPDAANEVFKNAKPQSKLRKLRSPEYRAEPEKEAEKPPKQKVRSEIPVPTRRPFSPVNRKQENIAPAQSPSPEKGKHLFPSRVVQSIAKSNPILDVMKSLDEAENILEKTVTKPAKVSSIPFSEFSDIFLKLRQWFKDSNKNVVLSVTKVINLCFKLIIPKEIPQVPNDFLSGVCLLLNFSHKGIRSAAVQALAQLNSIYPQFVVEIFIPTFPKLNVDGRKAGINLIKTFQFEMSVLEFCPFIMSCLADKSEEFRESAKPLVIRFINLPDGIEIAKQAADQFAPATKNLVLARLTQYEKQKTPTSSAASLPQITSFFRVKPTQEEKEQRQEIMDPYLPLKVLNCTEKAETLVDILQRYSDRFFILPITSTTTESIRDSCRMFFEIADSDFEGFSLVLDIVFLWWANQALLIKVQEGFNEIIDFLTRLIEMLIEKDRMLSEFEFSIILPTVLECYGRDEQQWDPIRSLIFQICDKDELLSVLVHLLSAASSIFTIIATFRTLMNVMQTVESEEYYDELVRCTKKIHKIVIMDQEQNQELLEVTLQFMDFLEEYKPKDVLDTPKKEPVEKITKPESPKPVFEEPIDSNKATTEVSQCQFDKELETHLSEPSVALYQWIGDLTSSDAHTSIQALKSITNQLKKDPNVFEPHIDALFISLLAKIHTHFSIQPIPLRLCKYSVFCVLTLFSETNLKSLIQYNYIRQLLFEILTHLSNGITEQVINQVLNALIYKLIDDCNLYMFLSLLTALGEYENYELYSMKWIKLALKCFDACGTRMCQLQVIKNIQTSLNSIESFLEQHSIEEFEETTMGSKVLQSIAAFVNLVASNFSEMIESNEIQIAPSSVVMQMISHNDSSI